MTSHLVGDRQPATRHECRPRGLAQGAYSGACRSAFRADADRDSGMMSIKIPGSSRLRFRDDADQKLGRSGMMIGMAGIVF
jgi:hypothetical protein